MITKIQLVIPGIPVQKNRPRIGVRGKKAVAYSDQKGLELQIQTIIKSQLPLGFRPLEGPVKVSCAFYKPRPLSHYGTGRNSGKLKKTAPAWPVTTPDLDNYLKWANDCMNGIIFLDDRQIICSSEKKRYCREPRTEIIIGTMGD